MVNKEWLLPIVSNKGLIIKGSWGKTHFDWSIHLHFWDFMAWKNTYPMKSSSFFFCMYTSFLSLHSCHSLSPWFCDCGSWVPCFAYIYNRKLFYPLSENCLWLILTERPCSFLSLRTIFAVRKITGLVNFIQATLIVLTKNFAVCTSWRKNYSKWFCMVYLQTAIQRISVIWIAKLLAKRFELFFR